MESGTTNDVKFHVLTNASWIYFAPWNLAYALFLEEGDLVSERSCFIYKEKNNKKNKDCMLVVLHGRRGIFTKAWR